MEEKSDDLVLHNRPKRSKNYKITDIITNNFPVSIK